MAELLEPIFGESGVIAAQFLITLLLVLLILAVAVWLFGQIVRIRLSGPFRGKRARRLSQIDAISVDGGRRAILLRRDNVEHLILIGGPTDIVVEQRRDEAAEDQPAREPRPRPGTRAEAQQGGERPARRPPPPPAPERRPPPRENPRPSPATARGEAPDRAARPSPPPRPPAADLPRPAPRRAPAASPTSDSAAKPDADSNRRDLAVFGRADSGPSEPTDRPPPLSPEERQEAARIAAAYAPPNRRPVDAAQGPAAAPQPAEPLPRGGPPRATPVAPAGPGPTDTPDEEGDAAPTAPGAEAATAQSTAEPAHPHDDASLAAEPAGMSEPELTEWAPGPGDQPVLQPELDEWTGPVPTDRAFVPAPLVEHVPQPPSPAEASRPEPAEPPQPPRHGDDDDGSPAERVGRLEEEMARLLGEISTRRRAGS